VSYLVRENGVWHRTTVWTLPANTTVHVTIYNFDGDSGLRNPFLAQARGVESYEVNGKPVKLIDPDDASHSFGVPSARDPRADPGRRGQREETSAASRRAA